jgi:hypothetical protein
VLTTAEIQQRIAMTMALAAENNPDDLEDLPPDLVILLGDLGIEDLRWLALYLGRTAAIYYLPREYRSHPEALPLAAEALREASFGFAVKEAASE